MYQILGVMDIALIIKYQPFDSKWGSNKQLFRTKISLTNQAKSVGGHLFVVRQMHTTQCIQNLNNNGSKIKRMHLPKQQYDLSFEGTFLCMFILAYIHIHIKIHGYVDKKLRLFCLTKPNKAFTKKRQITEESFLASSLSLNCVSNYTHTHASLLYVRSFICVYFCT